MRSWTFHRYTVASASPNSAVITRTGRPARTSSSTRRRNSTLQGRDLDQLQHHLERLAGRGVLLAVYQAVGDVQFGLSIQMDARRYPADAAALEPQSPFIDWGCGAVRDGRRHADTRTWRTPVAANQVGDGTLVRQPSADHRAHDGRQSHRKPTPELCGPL
jgi:hypothetical protein